MTDTHNHSDPVTFPELLASLGGTTAYREPMTPSASGQLLASNALAASLAYARQGPADYGPDMAFDLCTGSPAHHARVIHGMAAWLASGRSATAKRCAPYALRVAMAGYGLAMGVGSIAKPDGISDNDWLVLVNLVEMELLAQADEALVNAERAYFRAA